MTFRLTPRNDKSKLVFKMILALPCHKFMVLQMLTISSSTQGSNL